MDTSTESRLAYLEQRLERTLKSMKRELQQYTETLMGQREYLCRLCVLRTLPQQAMPVVDYLCMVRPILGDQTGSIRAWLDDLGYLRDGWVCLEYRPPSIYREHLKALQRSPKIPSE